MAELVHAPLGLLLDSSGPKTVAGGVLGEETDDDAGRARKPMVNLNT
jgi:hypothetical protein